MTRSIFILACAVLTACTTTSVSLDGASAPRARVRSLGSADLVAVDELRRFDDAGTLYDFLQRHRRSWNRP